jgi:hypothetical protein
MRTRLGWFGVVCALGGCFHSPDLSSADASGSHDLGNGAEVVSVAIAPPDQTLTIAIGATKSISYTATATYADGSTGPVTGSFSIVDPSIGAIDPVSGVFTANGVVGGATQVQFSANGGAMGSTSVTVDLTDTIIPMGASPSPDGLFAAAGASVTDIAAAANVLYPLDKVVFPQNITAPRVQWQIGDGSGAGGASDWYRITYAKPHINVVQYIQNGAGFKLAASVSDIDFSRIAETDPGMPATLTVDRLDVAGGRVVGGTPVTLNFAKGSISGVVYYWAMDLAAIQRIPAGTVNKQALFPPSIKGDSSNPGYSYGGCIACHQISRDGRYLVANGDLGYVFDLTVGDPTMPNMAVTSRPGFRWYFASISPDNSRIFSTLADASFGYSDLGAQARTPTGTVPTKNVAHPSWSPDGKSVAYVSNVSGWNTNASFTGGDLTLVDVDAATDVFSNQRVIHSGASLQASDPAGGSADCFPSWTPDSKYLMFAHTQNTRGTGATRFDGSLYIMPPTPGGTPVRLATASDAAGHALSHYPNTSPFISGGYYWIVYYSTRDYGNTLAGTKGTTRPQLWVSAVSTSFDGTHDPSSVPYWLPGQATANQNADAVWAASPCRMTGSSCLTSSDCCTGSCQPDGSGTYQCTPPAMCRREGESCERDSDCCGGGGLTCDTTIHTCQVKIL